MMKKDRKIGAQINEITPASQEGIHSLAWAQAVVPQDKGLFKLPIELRNLIYSHLFGDPSFFIVPLERRQGKFCNEHRKHRGIEICITLSQVCKQLFLDVTGSGLLYCTYLFWFNTQFIMTRYISSIPSYRNFRRIIVSIRVSRNSSHTSALATLASLPSLAHLAIDFVLRRRLCTFVKRCDIGECSLLHMYKVKSKTLEQLQNADWTRLKEKLLTFDLELKVYSRPVTEFHPGTNSGYLWVEDPDTKELERKIREAVLTK